MNELPPQPRKPFLQLDDPARHQVSEEPLNMAQLRELAEEVKWCWDQGKLNRATAASLVQEAVTMLVKEPYETYPRQGALLQRYYIEQQVYSKYWA